MENSMRDKPEMKFRTVIKLTEEGKVEFINKEFEGTKETHSSNIALDFAEFVVFQRLINVNIVHDVVVFDPLHGWLDRYGNED